MIGHKICFLEKYGELSLNYLGYPLLSRALMIGHKICFYGEVWRIIPKLSWLPLLIKSTDDRPQNKFF